MQLQLRMFPKYSNGLQLSITMCVNYTPTRADRLKIITAERISEQLLSGLSREDNSIHREAFPGYLAPILRADPEAADDGWRVDIAVFGLIPFFAKDRTFARRTYNARSETVAEKPSYRGPWGRRQFCLVPMENFYEPNWETGKAVRCKIHRSDDAPFTVAAIWDTWTDRATGEVVPSFSMLTINADGHPVMGRFHKAGDEKRSLVIVPPEHRSNWLSADTTWAQQAMLHEMPVAEFTAEASPSPPRAAVPEAA